MKQPKTIVHCWEDKQDNKGSYTCLAETGHKGKHKFVNDKDFSIEFK